MKNKLDEILASQKVSDILAATKLNDIIHKKEDEVPKKKSNTLLIALAVVGAIAAIAGIAYCVYRFMTPDYLDDFDDDFDDDFEEDFGVADEVTEESAPAEEL